MAAAPDIVAARTGVESQVGNRIPPWILALICILIFGSFVLLPGASSNPKVVASILATTVVLVAFAVILFSAARSGGASPSCMSRFRVQ